MKEDPYNYQPTIASHEQKQLLEQQQQVYHNPPIYYSEPHNDNFKSNAGGDIHLDNEHLIKNPNVGEEEEEGEKICRCCHSVLTENDDYIAPCKCTGSMKYVHRYCLDQWRAVSPRQESFYECDICKHTYVFKEVDENGRVIEHQHDACCGYKPTSVFKFSFFVFSDIALMLLVWQLLVFICVGFFALCDFDYKLRSKLFGTSFNTFLATYICGFVTFFFFVGLFGLFGFACSAINKCTTGQWLGNCCSAESSFYTYDTYPYYRSYYYNPWLDCSDMCFWYCFWCSLYGDNHVYCCFNLCTCCHGTNVGGIGGIGGGDVDCCTGGSCDCGGCNLDCGGDSNGGGVLVILGIILLVIVLIIAFIGFIFGAIAVSYFTYKIFMRRFKVLQKKEISKRQQIQNYWPVHY
ncbi:hypothetical protein ABK040_011540 [Willaertia magna]